MNEGDGDYPRRLVIFARRCVLCRRCLALCPRGALRMEPDSAAVDARLCLACGACVAACRTGAMAVGSSPQLG